MFLKEKHDSSLKSRGSADGRSQQECMSKEDTSSHTVSLEAMMISHAIDAWEERYVVVTDIMGAFWHTNLEQDVHMLLEGKIAKMIIKLEPSLYREFIWKNRQGKPMLYLNLRKAIYGTLQAVLLFWRLLSDTLIEWGFKLNNYVIANKIINRKQCTIIWHVDNLKISHIDKKLVENIINNLNKNFREYSLLRTNRGKKLEYLGMTLDYTIKGRVT